MRFVYNDPSMKHIRRELRQKKTPAEQILWDRLRCGQLQGYKFRSQYGIHCFVVDFYCPEARLAIEIDGGYHEDKEIKEYDKARQHLIEAADIRMLRFTNEQVYNELPSVLSEIKRVLDLPPIIGGQGGTECDKRE